MVSTLPRFGSIERLLRKYHPDLISKDPVKRKIADELTQRLNSAYEQLPWCINTGKSLIPLTLLFLHQKRNLLIPLELSRVMHQGSEMTLRFYGALNYSQNRARDLRCALSGA